MIREYTASEFLRFYYERLPIVSSAITGQPEGVDVSRWNVFFDPDLSQHPIDFAIQKLTEGTSYIDLALEEIWKGVAKVPVRGGYHYQRSGYSWKAQADHFLNVASRHDYHIFALDMESINNTYNDTFFADGRRIIDYWRTQSNKRVLLYTNGSTYKLFAAAIKRLYSDGQTWLDNLDFWYAWPSLTASEPILPTGCNAWKLWQYRWDGKNYGVNNNIDVNKFNGTLEQLHAWAGVTVTPPPPGDKMTYLEAVGNAYMKTGDAKSYPNAQINGVNQFVITGDIIETSERSAANGYSKISRIWRGGQQAVNEIELPPVAWFYDFYTKPSDFTPPVDPPTGGDVDFSKLVMAGRQTIVTETHNHIYEGVLTYKESQPK